MGNEFKLKDQYNPDVLECIANLSNDEVFTSPELANKVLDMLPQEIWSNKDIAFLDPCCKTGIFLREITKRLIKGLEKAIPNLDERINHILKNQVYGIAITELTSLMSRRTLYCSKFANSEFSICKFNDSIGNIRYKKTKHTWKKGNCIFCGASQKEYDRDDSMESYAYEFIHVNSFSEISNKHFDVIIGNPPFTLSDGGGDGSSTTPLYDKFILQCIKMKPTYIASIIQARWYSGGKGLKDFRDKMLKDERISVIHDYPETKDCFPGSNIRGGICVFLWDYNHTGNCKVFNHIKEEINVQERPLLEKNAHTFIRYNQAIPIVRKIQQFNEPTYSSVVSSRNHFDIPADFKDFTFEETDENNIVLYRSVRGLSINAPEKRVFISSDKIKDNFNDKDRKKVLVCKASPGGDDYPHAIISKPIFSDVNSVCTETYLIVDFVENNNQANNLLGYLNTKFFRFLVLLIKNTQNISKECFYFVPRLNLDEEWNDEKLYKKYNLSNEDIKFIEKMIKDVED